MFRSVRFLTKMIAWVAAAAIVLVAGTVIGLSSTAGNEWIRQQVLDAAAPAFPNGELVIASVNTNLLGHIELSDV